MLLGKAALLSILIAALTSATADPSFGESPGEDDGAARPTAAPEPELAATRATLDRHRAAETTPTPPRRADYPPTAATRAPFRGNAKFVNNIATTNQGYDYKPVSLSSRQPSRRPMTPETPLAQQRKSSSQKPVNLSRTRPDTQTFDKTQPVRPNRASDTSESRDRESDGEYVNSKETEPKSSSLRRPYDKLSDAQKFDKTPTSQPVRLRRTNDTGDPKVRETVANLEGNSPKYSSIRRPYDRFIGYSERHTAPNETVPLSTEHVRTYDKSISLSDRRPSKPFETSPVETLNQRQVDSDGESLRISRESSRHPEMIVRTIDDSTSTSAVSKQQKLRILIRSDSKKSTKKNKHGELVKVPSTDKVNGEPSTVDPSEEAEIDSSTGETTVDRLEKLRIFRNGEEIKEDGLTKQNLARPKNTEETKNSNLERVVESLLSASANGGNDKTNSSADDGDEDKKTLSQQVADGKYGLIHTELFSAKPTRPGIINYEINPEVPKDNVNNLGGLNAEEIWLAENHLLVLSGGGFSDQNSRTRWTPIDNYQAPRRQVKIPERPKVPPPFPVQLTDDGPIEFLKDENGTEHRPPFFPPDFNPLAFPPPFPPNGSFDGFPPPFPVPPGFLPGNLTPGAYPPFPPPYPFPPGLQNDSRPLPLPRLPPKLPFLPPPGNGNGTEFDEDDPALYYPPPYDFYFPKDNHSIVPPGPLVPGIVLPPPPDFFAPLNEKPKNKTKSKNKTRPRPNNTYLPPPPPKKVPQVFRTTTSTTTSTIATTVRPIVQNEITTPEYYYVQTTSPKPIADDITNEITQTTVSKPKYSLPIGENDWMPIPAPVPSYITGPKKPVKAGIVYTYTHTTPPANKPIFHGYTYEKPKLPFKETDLELYYKTQNTKYDEQQSFTPSNFSNQINNELNLVYPVDSDPQRDPSYVSSTGSPSPLYDTLQFKHNFKDYFGGTHLKGPKGFLQSTTDTPFKAYSSTLRPYGKPKALEATYYFYEEPKESSGEYTDGRNTHTKGTRKPHHASYPTTGDGFHSSTPRPIYNHGQTDFNSATSTTTPAPEKYYYVADLSDPEKFNSGEEKYKPSFFDETHKKPLKSEVGSRPIVEFSYSAPSYSSDSSSGHLSDYFNSRPIFERPKFAVTPKPENLIYVHGGRPTQSPLDDYYSTTKPPRIFKSGNRTASTQQTPWYGLTKQQIATDNPYYAFFTHQDDGLIDDITKTYFTIFGQKIKATPSSDIDVPRKHPRPHQPKPGGPAAPLLFNGAIYSSPKPNYIELPYQPVSHRPEHTTSNYESSSEDYEENFANRFTTTRPPQIAFPTYSAPHQNVQFTTPKPFYHGSFNPGNKLVPIQYSTPQPSVDSSNHHFNQRPIKIRPPTLYNDELVNYKRPLPPINPDAEFIAPRPFRNNKFKGRPRLPSGTSQIISYRLPGNGGGHFYFLTPQEVRNFDSIEPLAGENGETEDKGYYKRETHRTLDVEQTGKET